MAVYSGIIIWAVLYIVDMVLTCVSMAALSVVEIVMFVVVVVLRMAEQLPCVVVPPVSPLQYHHHVP